MSFVGTGGGGSGVALSVAGVGVTHSSSVVVGVEAGGSCCRSGRRVALESLAVYAVKRWGLSRKPSCTCVRYVQVFLLLRLSSFRGKRSHHNRSPLPFSSRLCRSLGYIFTHLSSAAPDCDAGRTQYWPQKCSALTSTSHAAWPRCFTRCVRTSRCHRLSASSRGARCPGPHCVIRF